MIQWKPFKGYYVVKKLVWNDRIKAFWYTNRYTYGNIDEEILDIDFVDL